MGTYIDMYSDARLIVSGTRGRSVQVQYAVAPGHRGRTGWLATGYDPDANLNLVDGLPPSSLALVQYSVYEAIK